MGWTKIDRAKFLKTCESNQPHEIVKQQGTLFEEDVEFQNKNKYQSIRLVLKYPLLTENMVGDPLAKQSARFMVSRYMNGDKKGEPIIFTNKNTGKKDAMIKSYQDSKIVNTTTMLREQIKKQLHEIDFYKFRGAIFITHMEFIFTVSKNAPQYMINDIKAGTKIYFKDTKPDLDNLEKLVWDSMQTEKAEKDIRNAMIDLVYDNDAQIVAKNCVFKRWGIIPGVIINMEGAI